MTTSAQDREALQPGDERDAMFVRAVGLLAQRIYGETPAYALVYLDRGPELRKVMAHDTSRLTHGQAFNLLSMERDRHNAAIETGLLLRAVAGGRPIERGDGEA